VTSLTDRLVTYLKAGYPSVAIETHEEKRAIGDILEAAKRANKGFATWSSTEGIRTVLPSIEMLPDTDEVFFALRARLKDTVLVMRDLQTWPLADPGLNRLLRDLLQWAPSEGSTIVFVGHKAPMHPTIEKLVVVLDYGLPTEGDLTKVAEGIAKSTGKKVEAGENVLRALSGLSMSEAENALALSYVEKKAFDPEVIYREKVLAVKRSGLLEIVAPDPRGLDAIGGLEEMKDWILRRRRAFSKEAIAFKLPPPKGIMIVGVPGCLAGDTQLYYLRGARVSGRTISLRDFHLKFNGLPAGSRPWVDLRIPTYLHSLGEDGEVFYNRVVSVREAGIKPIVRVEFTDAPHLRLTANHPVATASGAFIEAGRLLPGDAVLARGSMRATSNGGRDLSARPVRVIVNLKYHPGGARKIVGGHEYTRVSRARLVIEARMNGVDYEDFVESLKTDPARSAGFQYLGSEVDVHHLDENPMNDDPANLVVLDQKEHARTHGKYENFNVEYTREVHVARVADDGEEMTYDIEMELPATNFCANGIFVHNTGKSLASKAIGTALDVPTVRLDVGSLFNSLVGESESRTREVLKLAEAVAPCVLWTDEIDKGLAGASGSGSNDSGVTKRVFGTIISWMQERSPDRPVFLVATANDVTSLPPEFLRRGRWDEIFAVDLPHELERVAIFEIQLAKVGRDPKKFDLTRVIAATEGYTGAEIEAIVTEALYAAFDRGEEVSEKDLVAAAGVVVPLIRTAKEKVEALKSWAIGRARFASRRPADNTERLMRKLA
jgi:hypothetical protein